MVQLMRSRAGGPIRGGVGNDPLGGPFPQPDPLWEPSNSARRNQIRSTHKFPLAALSTGTPLPDCPLISQTVR